MRPEWIAACVASRIGDVEVAEEEAYAYVAELAAFEARDAIASRERTRAQLESRMIDVEVRRAAAERLGLTDAAAREAAAIALLRAKLDAAPSPRREVLGGT